MSQNSKQATSGLLTRPKKGHQTLLTSFRRNGKGVSTVVGTVSSQGKLYFMTPGDSWKVKRIANNARITLAPSTRGGQVLGATIEGSARRLNGEEAKKARSLLRIGFVGRMFNIIFDLRYPGDKTAVYEITLAAESVENELTNISFS
jgi:PPOX class probable F420-dependent enzyme